MSDGMRGEPDRTPAGPRPVGFRLEPGETILWQGRPGAGALRRHLLRIRWVLAYFAGLFAWKVALIVGVRGLRPQETFDAAILVVQAAALSGLLAWYARALARSTTYTATNLRVVIRSGIALRADIDIPMRTLRSVAVRIRRDGSGDVAFSIRQGGGIGYAKLWPHVRGFPGGGPAAPMLRGLDDAAILGTMLARGLDRPHAADPVSSRPAAEPLPPAARAA